MARIVVLNMPDMPAETQEKLAELLERCGAEKERRAPEPLRFIRREAGPKPTPEQEYRKGLKRGRALLEGTKADKCSGFLHPSVGDLSPGEAFRLGVLFGILSDIYCETHGKEKEDF